MTPSAFFSSNVSCLSRGDSRSRGLARSCFLACLILLLAACAGTRKDTLNLIYKQAAQYHLPDRNPIIVIPGILGSRLVDDDSGRTVWGAFTRTAINPSKTDDALLLALPLSDEPDSQHVRSDGVLDQVKVRLLGIPINIRAYVGIMSTLGVGGYRDEGLGLNGVDYGGDHFTCFQFGYDWRLDNVDNAARLRSFITEKKAYIRAEYKKRYGIDKADIKFDIVAHSMGGLVTRYFLRYGDQPLPADGSLPELNWAGAKDVARVVLVGTPNAGAPEAFEQLVNGYDPGRPILPHYPAAILGTYPSIYQLLPRPRHNRLVWDDDATPVGDFYDPELWQKNEWGLSANTPRVQRFLRSALPNAETDAQRREIVKKFQATALANAEQFHRALDIPARPPVGTDLHLVAGDAEKTPDLVQISRTTGKSRVEGVIPGDGTVPRYSALMDERITGEWQPRLVSPVHWSSVNFFAADHIGLTSEPGFADNILYLLLEAPRP